MFSSLCQAWNWSVEEEAEESDTGEGAGGINGKVEDVGAEKEEMKR